MTGRHGWIERAVAPTLERGALLELGHELVGTLRRHRVTTHATAIAFRVLISFVPVALLGIALLGVLGLESVWTDSIGPTLHHHLAQSVAKWQLPDAWTFIEAVPRTSVGKFDKKVIRRRFGDGELDVRRAMD